MFLKYFFVHVCYTYVSSHTSCDASHKVNRTVVLSLEIRQHLSELDFRERCIG